MAQYIELNAAVAEIERLKKAEGWCQFGKDTADVYYARGFRFACERIISFLDTLEVKEVDWENIAATEWNDYIRKIDGESNNAYMLIERNQYINLAKHFFELGLRVEDWKKKRMEECPYRQVGCTMYEGKILECRGACSWVVDYPKLKELKAQKGE